MLSVHRAFVGCTHRGHGYWGQPILPRPTSTTIVQAAPDWATLVIHNLDYAWLGRLMYVPQCNPKAFTVEWRMNNEQISYRCIVYVCSLMPLTWMYARAGSTCPERQSMSFKRHGAPRWVRRKSAESSWHGEDRSAVGITNNRLQSTMEYRTTVGS